MYRETLLSSNKYILLFVITPILVFAQESFLLETNAPSVKWKRIETAHFRVLFPKDFEVQAQRMANTLEHIYKPGAKTMRASPKKIDIILQNQSSLSNGFVTVFPRRSEFYTMPTQNYNLQGNLDWLDFLAIHEYRHIVQYQYANRGLTKGLSVLFGSPMLGVLSGLAAPSWFWEGDAVAIETAHTYGGRGRTPFFNLVFNTNIQEGQVFNYHKQYVRSYKHYIPNHYVLGYNMVSFLREYKKDGHIWEKILDKAWRNPFIPFTFSRAIKQETGMNVAQLYKTMAHHTQQRLQRQHDSLTFTSYTNITPRQAETYTNYSFPQVLDDGSIIAVKSGIADISRIVKITQEKERVVYTPGPINRSGMWSARKQKVAWNEYRFDPRWSVRNYSVLMVYNLATRQAKQITSKSRYAGADLSLDGNQVVTIETKTNYQTRLVILNSQTGEIQKSIDIDPGSFVSMPRWEGKDSIVALQTKQGNKSLVRFIPSSGRSEVLAHFKKENVGHPVPAGPYILYNSGLSGIDNIYALHPGSGRRYQVTSAVYGAYNPSISGDRKMIYYNDQDKNGLNIVHIPFNPSTWKPVIATTTPSPYVNTLTEQEGGFSSLDSIPTNVFQIKKHSPFRNIINPYSWGIYTNNSLLNPVATVGVRSQNVLSTTTLQMGYQWNNYTKMGGWVTSVNYHGWFPVLSISTQHQQRQANYTVLNRRVQFDWKEQAISAGILLPFNLTRSKYYTRINVSNKISYLETFSLSHKVFNQENEVVTRGNHRTAQINDQFYYRFTKQVDSKLLANTFSLYFRNQLKMSIRDFYPAWGQYLLMEHYSTPYGGDHTGYLQAIQATAFFPGIKKHHSLFFRLGWQNEKESIELNTYDFQNRISRPRGFLYPSDSRFIFLSSNYAFPLIYPDVHLGPFLNVQRIRTTLFYDYGKGKGNNYFYTSSGDVYYSNNNDVYSSRGTEIIFDINLFRFLPQFYIGLRYTHRTLNKFNPTDPWKTEILIGAMSF